MTDVSRRRNFARMLQRMPWLVKVAYPFYQLTRSRFTMGVVGVLFDSEGRVLLAEHVYHPTVPWSLPGGGVNGGEDPSDALIREYREEVAMSITVSQPLLIEQTYFRHVDIAFLCHSEGQPVVSSTELLDARWYAREALPSLTGFQYKALMCAYALAESGPRLTP